jgi:hypothetical protein
MEVNCEDNQRQEIPAFHSLDLVCCGLYLPRYRRMQARYIDAQRMAGPWSSAALLMPEELARGVANADEAIE